MPSASLDPPREYHVLAAPGGALLLAVNIRVLARAARRRLGAEQESVLSDVGGEVVLVGDVAAHHAGLALDAVEGDAEAGEEVEVGLRHGLVRPLAGAPIRVEGVEVLHEELTAPQESPLGELLVPKFVGNLQMIKLGFLANRLQDHTTWHRLVLACRENP